MTSPVPRVERGAADEMRRRWLRAFSVVGALVFIVGVALDFSRDDRSPLWLHVLPLFAALVFAAVTMRRFSPRVYYGWPHPHLAPGERLVWDSKTVLLGRPSISGGIALTDHRLIFTPAPGWFRQRFPQEWEPDGIVEVTSGHRRPPSVSGRWVGDLHIVFADGTGIACASITPELSRASFVEAWLALPELPSRT